MFRHGSGCILSKLLLQTGTSLGQLQLGWCYQNSEPFGQTCRPKECRLNIFTVMITAKEMCLISYFSGLCTRMPRTKSSQRHVCSLVGMEGWTRRGMFF